MGESDLVRSCLEELLAAEESCETQLREFSGQGDDDEVRAAFASHAEHAAARFGHLSSRLRELGGNFAGHNQSSANVLDQAPKLAQANHAPEEQIVQNLIAAYASQNGGCALYEVLAAFARVSGDEASLNLARQFQAQQARAAEEVWHFLPSRSKIAYNVLTLGEIDPSVETRTIENRVF